MALDKQISIRYDDNSAYIFVLAVTKLLSLTIKIAYADYVSIYQYDIAINISSRHS